MKIIKAMTFVITAGLLMGNQKCQQQQSTTTTPKRELKKIVDVGLISSPSVVIPGGGNFDFQFVLSQQIYPVLQESKKFWFRYDPIFQDNSIPTTQTLNLSKMNLTKSDYNHLLQEMTYNPPQVVFSDDVSCFVNLPQLKISGNVNSFEMLNKIGLNIGFTNSGSTTNSSPSLGFQTETFQLDMNLMATSPLTKTNLAAVHVTAKQTKTSVNFFVPFQNLLLSPSFYFQTPLAKVSYNALSNGVSSIATQLDDSTANSGANAWTSRVLFDHEEGVTILAGTNHNVQVGDVFDIYNEKAYWTSNNGEVPVPCESELKGTIPGPVVATIEIDWVGEDLARGKVIYETGEPRKMGALVKINKLVESLNTADAGNAQ